MLFSMIILMQLTLNIELGHKNLINIMFLIFFNVNYAFVGFHIKKNNFYKKSQKLVACTVKMFFKQSRTIFEE